jgi:hypothetical protein
LDYMIRKGFSQTSIPNPKYIHYKRKNNKFKGPLCSSNMEIKICNFIILFGNILFPMLAAEWLRLVLSTEYSNSRQIFI